MATSDESRTGLRTVLVDDEPLARTNLRVLLRRHAHIEIVGESGSGFDALEEIRGKKPDLVFLDVQMPECDGFDVLEMLGRDVPAAVIFVTAYDQYALRAFEAGALDYLLKPFDDARFERALRRAEDKIREKIGRHRPASRTDRLTVKTAGQILFLEPGDVDWIEAADYYACLHVGVRTHMLRRSMSELELDLDPNVFCRVHRSAIVNLARVRAIQLNRGGEYEVLLHNGVTVPVSRRHRRRLQSAVAANTEQLEQRDRFVGTVRPGSRLTCLGTPDLRSPKPSDK